MKKKSLLSTLFQLPCGCFFPFKTWWKMYRIYIFQTEKRFFCAYIFLLHIYVAYGKANDRPILIFILYGKLGGYTFLMMGIKFSMHFYSYWGDFILRLRFMLEFTDDGGKKIMENLKKNKICLVIILPGPNTTHCDNAKLSKNIWFSLQAVFWLWERDNFHAPPIAPP